MVAAVIAAFLYLRIMVSMWLADPPTTTPEPLRRAVLRRARHPAAAGFTLAVGIFPGWLIEAADHVTQYAR